MQTTSFSSALQFVDRDCRKHMPSSLIDVYSSIRGSLGGDVGSEVKIRTAAVGEWWFSSVQGYGDLTMMAENLDLFANHALLLLNQGGESRRLNHKPLFPPPGQITLGLSASRDASTSSGNFSYLCIYLPIEEVSRQVGVEIPYGRSVPVNAGPGKVLGAAIYSLATEILAGRGDGLGALLPAFSNLALATLLQQETQELYTFEHASRMSRIVAYLQRHFTDPEITPEDAANAINISRRQLDRELARAGVSFGTLLRELRLQRACHLLLADPASNISLVAYQVGFNNPTVFGRVFREKYGAAPREFCAVRLRKLLDSK
jgi:AraC-like DNA-binding protein